MIVGFVTVLISAVYGCVMAYFGGWIDKIMLFILETLIMVPSLLILAILINGQVGSRFRRASHLDSALRCADCLRLDG